MHSEFYKQSRNKDGLNTMCKACYKVYNRESRTIECESCGREMYKHNGFKVCYECRDTEYHHDRPICDSCVFAAECKHNIWKATFTPYCFKTSKYHGLYENERVNHEPTIDAR
jgi:ribosomal protein S27E